MKASLALALTGAFLAVASPIDKRVMHTDYVTDIVYVTVTVDPPAPSTSTSMTQSSTTTTTSLTSSTPTSTLVPTTSSVTTTSTPPPPPPPPTTTSTPPPPPPPTTTTPPPPPPTTTTPPPPPPPPPTTTETPKAEIVTVTKAATPAAAATTAAAVVNKPAAAVAAAPAPVAPAKEETTSPAAKATTTKAAASAQPSDFSSTAVYHHNLHRSNHSAPAMSWNSDLASYAATVAASCVFAHDLTPGASTGSYGQNIAVYGASGDVSSIDSSKIVAQAITDMWYNGEVWQYPADGYGQSNPDMTNFEAWGHFSQVVWAASTEVGCASQYCAPGTIYSGMGSWFTVCDYRSEGNMGGEYGSNVLPSLGQGTVTASL